MVSCDFARAAHASTKLHVESCIFVLNVLAASNAYSGAITFVRRDVLGPIRGYPSACLAFVNTFGLGTGPLTFVRNLDTSPQRITVDLRLP